jgi:CxxC-x17-CxxC domain-containing protein
MRNNNWSNNSRGKYNNSDRQMHEATCGDCGEHCKVPFKPNRDTDVYCSSCYGKRNSQDKRDSYGGSDSFSKNSGYEKRDNFSKPKHNPRPNTGVGNPEKAQKRFKQINQKLNKVLGLLKLLVPAEEFARIMEDTEETQETSSRKK